MAVAHVATTTQAFTTSATSFTITSKTFNAGEVVLLNIAIPITSATQSVNTVTSTGLTWTKLGASENTSSNNTRSEVWYAKPTVSFTNTIVITLTGSTTRKIATTLSRFSGVDQTTPFGNTNFTGTSSSGVNTAVTVTLASTTYANSLVVGFAGNNSSSATMTSAGTGQTVSGTINDGGTGSTGQTASALRQNASTTSSGTSVTMNGTLSSNSSWCCSAVELKAYVTPLFSTLTDSFDNNVIDTTLWNNWGGSNVSETNQNLEISTTANSTAYFGIGSLINYDLTGCAVSVRINSAGTALSYFQNIPILLTKDASNSLAYYIINGELHAQKQVAGTYADVGTFLTYNATSMQYIRIRESGGTIFWDYSSLSRLTANPNDWTNHTSLTNPFAVTSFQLNIEVGNTSATSPTVATAKIDDLNLIYNGYINSIEYYASNTLSFKVLLFNGNKVMYKSPSITPSATGLNTYTLPNLVGYNTGWILGFWFSSTGTIPFDATGTSISYWTGTEPNIGDTITWTGTSTRTYSINARNSSNVVVLGNNAINRSTLDTSPAVTFKEPNNSYSAVTVNLADKFFQFF